MANDFYTKSGSPGQGSHGASATIRNEFNNIEAGFDKLPDLTGNASKLVRVNAGATGLEATTSVDLTSGTLVLPQGTAVAPTTEGQLYWNTSTDVLTVGNGAAAEVMVTTDNTQTLTNKTVNLTSNTLSGTKSQFDSALSDDNFAYVGTANTFSTNQLISVNSASNALEIRQIGAGNALVVEDSANPDATPFVVDATGKVIFGSATTYPITAGTDPRIQMHEASLLATFDVVSWANDTNPPNLKLAKAKSGTIGTYTSPSSGDVTGRLRFYGADGSAFVENARISAEVDGTPGASDMPGRLVFYTTADGASTPIERMRIDSSGNVGIGGASGGSKLQTTISSMAATTATGSYVNGTADATATTVNAFSSFIGQAASGTVTDFSHYRCSQGTISGTVTNQYGVYVANNLTGATNNFGVYSNIASGANRWNFYAAGTANNAFAGDVRIGSTTAPTVALDVTGAIQSSTTVTAGTGVTVTTGNVVIGTSGNGIDFSATTSGSGTMTSELLSDYEEGTFTPTVTFGGGSTGVTYTSQQGRYTKIGRLVTYQVYVLLSSKGSSTGNLSILGLPFTSSSGITQSAASVYLTSMGASVGGGVQVVNPSSSSYLQFNILSAGGSTFMTDAECTNTSGFTVTGHYTV